MPGYIFTLKGKRALEKYAALGAYGTWPAKTKKSNLYTLGDYLTIKENDLIFFFSKRMIYGVGRVVKPQTVNKRIASACNFPGSDDLNAKPGSGALRLLDSKGTPAGGSKVRWMVFFDPYPRIMKQGVDMDEALLSDKSSAVRQLRVFERLNFIQVEDEEARVLTELLLQKNKDALTTGNKDQFFDDSTIAAHHQTAFAKAGTGSYSYDPTNFVKHTVITKGKHTGEVRIEAALQASIVHGLAEKSGPAHGVFGDFDVIINQYTASPLKPPIWMDRIDIFGYVRKSFGEGLRITTEYKIIEVKREPLEKFPEDKPNPINQTMKYVDWVANTRAGGDYTPVRAFLVAKSFSPKAIQHAKEISQRPFLIPRRPYTSSNWGDLSLVSYNASQGGKIDFTVEYAGTAAKKSPP